MRNRGAILGSVMLIILASMLVGAGTTAYFSDTESAKGDFKAATFDMTISNVVGDWSQEEIVTWECMNMCPGDWCNATFYVHNNGSQPIKCLLMKMEVIGDTEGDNPEPETNTWGDGELDDYFYVMRVCVDIDGVWVSACCYDIDELIRSYCSHVTGSPANTDDIITYCFPSGTWLEPSHTVSIFYAFQFKDTGVPQNDAMGDTLTIKYSLEARSSTCSP